MTGGKGVSIIVLLLAITACLAAPVMAASPASDAKVNESAESDYYDEGTQTGNLVKKEKLPAYVFPVIPPGVPRNITPLKDATRATFVSTPLFMQEVQALGDPWQKKNDSPRKAEENASLPGQSTGTNNSSIPAKNVPGNPEKDGSKQNPHWLNSTAGSLNNLTKEDQLYVSWTNHLDTPRAIALNSSVLKTPDNRPGTKAGEAKASDPFTQDQSGKAREITHQRIAAMMEKMGALQSYAQNSSSLTAAQKMQLSAETENQATWLRGKEAEMQSLNNTGSVQDSIVDVEFQTSVLEAELQRNMGLLACNEMNFRISEALNTSLSLDDRLGRQNLSDADHRLVKQYLADCRQHLLNASLSSDDAAQYFQSVDGQDDTDGFYQLGLERLQQSKKELNMAYLAINKIFHRTVDYTNI